MLHTEPWVRQAGAIVTGVAVGGTARLCRSLAVPAVMGSSGSSRLRGVAQRAGAARRGVVPLQEPGTLQPLPGLQVPRAPGLPAPPWSQLSSDTSSCAASPYVRQDAGVGGEEAGRPRQPLWEPHFRPGGGDPRHSPHPPVHFMAGPCRGRSAQHVGKGTLRWHPRPHRQGCTLPAALLESRLPPPPPLQQGER